MFIRDEDNDENQNPCCPLHFLLVREAPEAQADQADREAPARQGKPWQASAGQADLEKYVRYKKAQLSETVELMGRTEALHATLERKQEINETANDHVKDKIQQYKSVIGTLEREKKLRDQEAASLQKRKEDYESDLCEMASLSDEIEELIPVLENFLRAHRQAPTSQAGPEDPEASTGQAGPEDLETSSPTIIASDVNFEAARAWISGRKTKARRAAWPAGTWILQDDRGVIAMESPEGDFNEWQPSGVNCYATDWILYD